MKGLDNGARSGWTLRQFVPRHGVKKFKGPKTERERENQSSEDSSVEAVPDRAKKQEEDKRMKKKR